MSWAEENIEIPEFFILACAIHQFRSQVERSKTVSILSHSVRASLAVAAIPV